MLKPIELQAQEPAVPEQNEILSDTDPMKPRYGIAFAEAMGSSLLLLGINRFIRNADYSYISFDSMGNNITSPWVWDQDEFSVNQLGHPYQGSFYYIAGRSNGLNFWTSTALTAANSTLWELLMETETPSINDIITTTAGGISLGETFHRMYVVLDDMPYPLRFFKIIFSPFDALNDALFGKPERGPGYSSLYLDETYFSTGAGLFLSRMDQQRNDEDDISMFSMFLDLNIVYGDPYTLRAAVPYQNFEVYARFNFAYPSYSIDLFSNGDLYTLGLWGNSRYDSALSLNLHYDFIFGSLINFSAHSLGLGYKTHNQLSDNWDLSFKLHTNWVFLGASEYIPIWYGDIYYEDPDAEHRNYDFSIGTGIKTYFNIRNPLIGTFNISLMAYFLHTIDGAVPENGSPGFSLIGTGNVSYEREIVSRWYFGLMASGYLKYGHYSYSPDIFETTRNYTVFVKKRF